MLVDLAEGDIETRKAFTDLQSWLCDLYLTRTDSKKDRLC